MKTGDICKKYKITRDTLRFYIKKELLDPDRTNQQYEWTKQNEQELQNILALRDMGLSISTIQKIKYYHEQSCGTLEQASQNYHLLVNECFEKQNQVKQLQHEITAITSMLKELKKAITERK